MKRQYDLEKDVTALQTELTKAQYHERLATKHYDAANQIATRICESEPQVLELLNSDECSSDCM